MPDGFLCGNVHGDLHRRNIMCQTIEQKKQEYFLIDYDSFSNKGYLLYDQAYLEMSIYFDEVISYDIVRWIACMKNILHSDIDEKIDKEIDEPVRALRNAICRGITKWENEAMPNNRDVVELQYILVRIAAGINFFSKAGITDEEQWKKILIYISLSIQAFFKKIGYDFLPSSEETTDFTDSTTENEVSDEVYDHWAAYVGGKYISILITDDCYRDEEYEKMRFLSNVKWSLIIDIGDKVSPNDIDTNLIKYLNDSNRVEYVNLLDPSCECSYIGHSCLWITAKKDSSFPTYGLLWQKYKRTFSNLMQQINACNALKPLLVLMDFDKGGAFAQQFLSLVLEYKEQMRGSRFVELRKSNFSSDDIETIQAVKMYHTTILGATLIDCAIVAKKFIASQESEYRGTGVYLPSIDPSSPAKLTEKEIQYYSSSVELVYSGLEACDFNIDYGMSFYKGKEITWKDLADNVDIPLLDDYQQKRDHLFEIIENELPRVKTLKLLHGSGTGGTTLSKRLLWDLKDRVPCLRLIRYTKDTVSVLMDIYKKTRKRLLLTVEMGSSVINVDELNELIGAINEQNGKLIVLQIDRKNINTKNNMLGKAFIHLRDKMDNTVAKTFSMVFKQKTMDKKRHDCIDNITTCEDYPWREQRCPFFYGFYAFQEDYELGHIANAICACTERERELLSDMSLVTQYSQNIFISIEEIMRRYFDDDRECVSYSVLYESVNSSVRKFIVENKKGWRICHPLIAKKILETIHGDDYSRAVYESSLSFLKRKYEFFGNKNERIDAMLRELFIDRAYFDSEKSSFSRLMQDVEHDSRREHLFSKLIEYYPDNDHYYNHMGRLLSGQSMDTRNVDYNKAISMLKKAIEVANNAERNLSSHYVTLGVIFSKKIIAYISEAGRKIRTRNLSPDMKGLLAEIRNDYISADYAYRRARNCRGRHNSYLYYPNILMETSIIEKLVRYIGGEKTLSDLYEQDYDFRNWYRIHYGKLVQYLYDMQNRYEIYDTIYIEYMKRAKTKIQGISLKEFKNIGKEFSIWLYKEGDEAIYLRRMYASAIYAHEGFQWGTIERNLLKIIEQGMRKNILHSTSNSKQVFDAYYWYQSYRRLPNFDPSDVIRIYEDFCDKGYQKEYVLYIMYFLKACKELSSAEEVLKHISLCKNLLPPGINDFKPRDVYMNEKEVIGSPVVPHNELSKKKDISKKLKLFTGRIISVSQGANVGRIQLDDVNLIADFNPVLQNGTEERVEFTIADENESVKFNIMFSYSGLRAWNVQKMCMGQERIDC